ncbi:hypothetical protein GQ457_06G019340 [Hibiscus cannabinus]
MVAVASQGACLWSFLVSLGGGLLLGWWEYEYHPENRQLWMVPFGLILFSTPLIIWFAIFVSDICSCTDCSPPAAGEALETQWSPPAAGEIC